MGESHERVARSEVERRLAAFEAACRDRHLAATTQRRVIYRALASTTAHPTAEELFVAVRRDLPSISLATVYKNLTTFRDEGLLRALHTDSTVRWDAKVEQHHHLTCRVCGRVDDLHDPSLDAVDLPQRLSKGFRVEEHEVLFRGVCAACDAAS